MNVVSLEDARRRDDLCRRIAVQQEVNACTDSASEYVSMNIIRALARDLSEPHDSQETERAAMLYLAGCMVAMVEKWDRVNA